MTSQLPELAPQESETIAETRSKLSELRKRIWDFFGITALTAFILGLFRKREEAPVSQPAVTLERPMKQAVAAPSATKRAPSLFRKAPRLTDGMPQDQNLVGRPAMTFTIDDANHTITFQPDKIILDGGNIFALSALGTSIGDVSLDIKDARITDGNLALTAGAWGQYDTVILDEAELITILRDLVRGKPVRSETDEGKTIEIAPKKY